MTTRKDLEAKCEELRHLWRAFSTDQNGVCEETPDETFEAGFHAALDLTWPMVEELKARLDDERYEERKSRGEK